MKTTFEKNKTAWLVPLYAYWDGISKLMIVRLQYMSVKKRREITVFTFHCEDVIPYGYTIHIIADKILNGLKEDQIIDGTLLK